MSFAEGKKYDRGFRVDPGDVAIGEEPGLDGYRLHTFVELPDKTETDITVTLARRPPCDNFEYEFARWLEISLNTAKVQLEAVPEVLTLEFMRAICQRGYES